MGKKNAKQIAQDVLDLAEVKIDGNQPEDIQVHNPKFYSRVLAGGSLALGESYMDGWWDCKELDQFFDRILRANLNKKVLGLRNVIWPLVKSKLVNMQSKSRSLKVAKQHYDLDNNLYEKMLDKNMQYTCGYWRKAKNLDEAQEDKLDLICKKLNLKKGESVLELGCGFGGFARFAAKKYGCRVTCYNISKEQAAYARKICRGLPVEIRLQDYRGAKGKFDKVAAIGICEHIGRKNYRKFMQIAYQCLKPGGLFLLHTIGRNTIGKSVEPWINKYIFPHGELPSPKQISAAAEGLFVLEDWHSFGPDYDKTLMAWHENFEKNWGKLKGKYDERFARMWRYYLLCCAGAFRARKNQLWQVVFSKKGVKGGYQSVR